MVITDNYSALSGVGTMALRTTDPNEVRFAGHNGRNSSRVLAPPGGASNFSFADMGETPAPANKVDCQAQRAESHAYDGWTNQSPVHKAKTVDPQDQLLPASTPAVLATSHCPPRRLVSPADTLVR